MLQRSVLVPSTCLQARFFCANSQSSSNLARGARDHPWRQLERLNKFLATKQVCIIDGANGTEIQRRGGKPAETFFSGTAALMRPDLCQEVHEAYLEAGADIIITHSYSSNGNVMSPSGNGGRVGECILYAASLARRAVLNHVTSYAMKVANEASAHNTLAAQAAASAATAAARATTSMTSNSGASASAQAALSTAELASVSSNTLVHTMKEVQACAAAAEAASAAALAASEGEPIPDLGPPVVPPEPVSVQGWDTAGFGPALVVGSLSTHPPEMTAGGESSLDAKWPDAELEAKRYLEAARAHALSGVDMLFLEMMKDLDHAPRAVRAAAASGLPVFLGVSGRTDQATGELVLWGNGSDAIPVSKEWFQNLATILGPNLVGVNVMHTNFSTMASLLKFVRDDCGWEGPLGAYPDHGRFEAPDWIFQELDTSEAMELVDEWIRDYNVQMVGGCCGLGPEFISALSAHIRRHNAQVRGSTLERANQAL